MKEHVGQMSRFRRSALGVAITLLLGSAFAQPQVFRHAYGDTIGTLDPAATYSHIDWEIMLQVYERLLRYGEGRIDVLEPELASEIPSLENGLLSEDGLTYVFPLREGVTFHDGSEFTAEDVVYTFRRMFEMDLPQAKVQDYFIPYVDIDRVVALDAHTVQIGLKRAYPGFLFALADPSASIVSMDFVEAHGGIAPGKENEWMRWNTSGTGPFVLQEIIPPGERVVLVRNENYWGQRPTLDRIETLLVSDPATQILMLKNGEVHQIEIGAADLKNIANDPNILLVTGLPALRSHAIKFQQDIDTEKMDAANTIPADFFADINVRKGFAYAFPYDPYVRVYLPDDARYAGPIPNGMFGDNPDTPMYEFDLEKSAEYFRQTRWWDEGFTITAYTLPNWGTWPQAISLLADALKQVNPKFDVQMRSVEWATMVRMTQERSIPIMMSAIRGVTADPDSLVRQRMFQGGWDGMGTNDPEIDALVDQAAAELDADKRAERYAELEQIAYDRADTLWLTQDSGFLVYRKGVQGYSWHPIFQDWASWRNLSISN